jgi:hypothetical protein
MNFLSNVGSVVLAVTIVHTTVQVSQLMCKLLDARSEMGAISSELIIGSGSGYVLF